MSVGFKLFDDFGARRARQGTKKPRRRTIWQGLTLRISVDMMYDPRLQIYCNSPFRLLSQALASHFVKHELWERRVQLGDRTGVCWIDRDAAACVNLLYADLDQQTYDPKRIREAVLAGVTAWLDAGVVVIQAREGITEREFRRFRRRGIPSLAVQGLRQKGFRGRSDSKSGATPEEKSLGQIETFPL